MPVQLDVTDADRVAAVARELDDIQLVVNNAGIARPGTPLSVELDAARAELEVNYLSLITTTQAFAPVLAANGGGAFVNVLSVGSWIGTPTLSTYAASKSAAWNFTNAARVELKHQGTHVVGVHVGFVDTDLTAALEVDKIAPAAVAGAALDAIEAGEPEAVVDDLSRQVKAGLSDDQRTPLPTDRARLRGPDRIPDLTRGPKRLGQRQSQSARREQPITADQPTTRAVNQPRTQGDAPTLSASTQTQNARAVFASVADRIQERGTRYGMRPAFVRRRASAP